MQKNQRYFCVLLLFMITICIISYLFVLLEYPRIFSTNKADPFDVRNIALRPGSVSAVTGLLTRLIPKYAGHFHLILDTSIGPPNKDTFKLESASGSLVVTGTSAVALAMGVHHYLKYLCKAHVSWNGNQLDLPNPLPIVQIPIVISTQDKFRHYQNVCTPSYSMVWWDWARWEKEIDWMALNGINLPLAFTAQEAIWRKVFLDLGFTDLEINAFFTGPAFLAWNRMGNIQAFGGPLSSEWHQKRVSLQKQILERMRLFGMFPVLPAFAGRVVPAFQRVFPNASVTHNSAWVGLQPPFCCTSILDPEDPLFLLVGTKFLEEYKKEFALDHFYSADLFNEMVPPTSNTSYLGDCGRVVFKAMTAVDEKAIWVMQGWIFVNDPVFWKPPQAKALLTSVPLGRMVVLDLEAEFHPQYENFESFYGQPFIWCIIHNYGGVEGLYGSFDAINQGPFKGRAFPNSSMIGTGLTPEGIERNDVMYDLMNEMAWRQDPVDLDDWILNYTTRRYGKVNNNILKGWTYLKESVFNANQNYKNHGKYIFNTRPALNKKPYVWYNASDVITALNYFLQEPIDPELLKQETFVYDMVDFTRQGYQLLFDSLYFNVTEAFAKNQLQKVETISAILLSVLDHMEELLSTLPRFTLKPWISSASAWATTLEEEIQYEYNLRNQISLWGPNGEIMDYANKQWSGVVSGYFKPRWDLFLNMLQKSLIQGMKFKQNDFNTMVLLFVEEPFTFEFDSSSANTTSTFASEHPLETARHIFERYGSELYSLKDFQALEKTRSKPRLRKAKRKHLPKKLNNF